MKKFATLLEEAIEASGMKQTRIASAAHISYNYLLRLLAGDRHPSESVALKVAEAMRLSVEQTSELLAAAGFAPSPMLIQAREHPISPAPARELSQAARFIQQFSHLAQEIPDTLQEPFLEEMNHFLNYARYKYILSGGANLLDLDTRTLRSASVSDIPSLARSEQIYLNLLAQIVGELHMEGEEGKWLAEEQPQTLLVNDAFRENELFPKKSTEQYQPEFVKKVFSIIQSGTSWDMRYHITKALPDLCQLDVSGTEQLMNILRLDTDEVHGADIRRRVVEALPAFFEASPFSLPTVVRLLHPIAEDDIYVALATVEACGEIQNRIKQLLNVASNRKKSREKALEAEKMTTLTQKYQPEISRIQRLLLLTWDGVEREGIQFSMTLYDLLCAPDTMLLSLHEGLHSTNVLLQIVATRYLEHLLLVKPLETLELYQKVLQEATIKNVRRTVAKALPVLLHCLEETSLSTRTLARQVISMLATDSDLYIRRAIADHAIRIFYADRDFLLVLLRTMQKDEDPIVRLRLQSVALRLAQFWLSGYAEATGLIEAKSHHKQGSVLLAENEVK